MKFVPADSKSIQEAGAILKAGGLVAFPTETVYGLGADAFNTKAVARIFEVKNRPYFDPLIVHIHELSLLRKLAAELPPNAEKLIKKFWPGPLTLVLPKKGIVPDIVTAGLATVALRMPDHPIALELIEKSGVPVAAPSANPFEYLSPTTARHVRDQLGEKIDMILDGGPCLIGLESTVIDFSEKEPMLLRPGGLALEEIESIIGKIKISNSGNLKSPGQLEKHYSPRTPVKITLNKNGLSGKKIGLLAFKSAQNTSAFKKIEILSADGDLKEAAARFFSCLHSLDEAGLDLIYAEPLPETGLGRAIMNRLRKAKSV